MAVVTPKLCKRPLNSPIAPSPIPLPARVVVRRGQRSSRIRADGCICGARRFYSMYYPKLREQGVKFVYSALTSRPRLTVHQQQDGGVSVEWITKSTTNRGGRWGDFRKLADSSMNLNRAGDGH